MRSALKPERWVPAAVGIAFLGLWELFVRIAEIPPFVLPAPSAVAALAYAVVASLAEVLWKPMPMAQVGVFMVWHSVGLEGMWNWPAGHMKALTLTWAQVLVEVVQNNPVVAVQSVVPH